MKNNKRKLKTNFAFLIVIFIFSFFAFHSREAHAAALYLDPVSGEYGAGDTFLLAIRIDNEEACVNAASVRLRYPPSLLRVVDFSKGGSLFSLWVEEPVISNEEGIVSFTGGIPAGYCGRIQGDPALSNVIGKIVFRVPAEVAELEGGEAANVEILSGSEVYLNDGLGTPADVAVRRASFLIHPESPSPVNEWFDELSEDTVAPESFKIRLEQDQYVYGGKYFVVFSAVDRKSGVDYYEVFEDGKWRRAESPHLLGGQTQQEAVRVRALDKAGNMREGEFVAVEAATEGKESRGRTSPAFGAGDIFLILFVAAAGIVVVALYRRWPHLPDR